MGGGGGGSTCGLFAGFRGRVKETVFTETCGPRAVLIMHAIR